MIGSLPLTTCNCDIVAPHATFETCELKWKLTKIFDSGNLLVYMDGASGVYCPGFCTSTSPGSIGSRWTGSPPYGGEYKRVVVDQLDEGEATWTTFTEVAVQTVSGTSGGKYYRPGTATTSGGVVIAQNLTCKFRIYEATPSTASTTLTTHGEVSSEIDCYYCGTYTSSECVEYYYGYGSRVVTTGPTGSSTFSYPHPLAKPPKIQVRWLAATQRVVGLKLTLTAAGSALGEWFVTKGPSGLTLSCATVTLVYPPTGKITPASTGVRAQIQATGYFTAVADSTVTTNAEVGDLQEMSKYLNGNANCVELVLVPLNSIAAPSSIRFIKTIPGFAPETKYLGFDAGFNRDDGPVGSCSPTGSCTKGWVFQLNREWTDDEDGFKQFISAARGIRIDVTNQALTDTFPIDTSNYLQQPSPTIPLYRFDVRYKAPTGSTSGQTGWDYLSGPTASTRIAFSLPSEGGLPITIISSVDSGCLDRNCEEALTSPCSHVAGNCPGVSVPYFDCYGCPGQTLHCNGWDYHVCHCRCCQQYTTEIPTTLPAITAAATLELDGNFRLVAT